MAQSKKLITNNLWFDNEAEEAAEFYTSLFDNSVINKVTRYGKEGYEIHKRPEGSVMTVEFHLGDELFVGLNGGPVFEKNPSVSYFVVCTSEKETNDLWKKLSEGGKVLMALDKYDWSEKYGWVEDRFGVSWQVSLGKLEDVGQKITPCWLFGNKAQGRAEEAINFYTSVFKGSGIVGVVKYTEENSFAAGQVTHAQFKLAGQVFMAMDSGVPQAFTFNEGVSFIINCHSQEEIDYYWNKLTEGGEESQCGWLKDKFGFSWQVVPVQLAKMLESGDKEKTGRVTNAFMKMQKFDLAELEAAYEGK